jgi:hypothetical protein
LRLPFAVGDIHVHTSTQDVHTNSTYIPPHGDTYIHRAITDAHAPIAARPQTLSGQRAQTVDHGPPNTPWRGDTESKGGVRIHFAAPPIARALRTLDIRGASRRSCGGRARQSRHPSSWTAASGMSPQALPRCWSCRSRTCGWMRRRRGGGGGSADGRWGCLFVVVWRLWPCSVVVWRLWPCPVVVWRLWPCFVVVWRLWPCYIMFCGGCGHVLLLCGGCGHVLLLCGGCGHVLLLCGGCGHVVWRLWPFRTSQGWVGGIKNTRRPRGTRAGPSPLRPTHRTCEHVGMAPTRRPFVKNREQMLDADAGARRK